MTLNVPAGVDDGQNFKTIPGEGEPGRNGGPAGDLYITCTVRPHKIFKRDRYDLYCDCLLYTSSNSRQEPGVI